jgi:hypothetical protein
MLRSVEAVIVIAAQKCKAAMGMAALQNNAVRQFTV